MWSKITPDIFTRYAAYWLQTPDGTVVYGIPSLIANKTGFVTLEKGWVDSDKVSAIRPVNKPDYETGETKSETKIKKLHVWCESWNFTNVDDLPQSHQVMVGAAHQIKEILE